MSDDGWDVAGWRWRRRGVGTSGSPGRWRDRGRTNFVDGNINDAIAGGVADFDFLRGPRGEGVVADGRLKEEAGAGFIRVDGDVVGVVELLKALMKELRGRQIRTVEIC